MLELVDALRGVAVAMVLILHYIYLPTRDIQAGLGWYIGKVIGSFWAGVDLFFVISGFLVAKSLSGLRSKSFAWFHFFVRRSFRLLPLYWLMVGIQAAGELCYSGPHSPFAGGLPIANYLLFLQNAALGDGGSYGSAWMTVSWSLAVEIHAYLILAAIFLLCAPSRIIIILSLGAIASTVLRGEFGYPGGYAWTICRLDSIFLGALAYMGAARYGRVDSWLSRVLMGLGLLMVCLGFFGGGPGALLSHLFFGLGFALVVYTCAVSPSANADASDGIRILIWLGRRAYPIYLFHFGILSFMFALFHHGDPRFEGGITVLTGIVALIVTLIASNAVHVWFELPIIRQGNSLSARLSRTAK